MQKQGDLTSEQTIPGGPHVLFSLLPTPSDPTNQLIKQLFLSWTECINTKVCRVGSSPGPVLGTNAINHYSPTTKVQNDKHYNDDPEITPRCI